MRVRTQRGTNAEFTLTPSNGILQHSIDADGREHKRHQAEDDQQEHVEIRILG
jgi:hypothetical protein